MIMDKQTFNKLVEELNMKPFFPESVKKRALLVIPFIGEKAVVEAVKLKAQMDEHGVVSKVIINAEDK